MRELVLEYVLEGRQRGYNFTSPTQGFHDDTLKAIWRGAMPRGQGWGVPGYVGARSLKCFVLDDGRAVVSEVVVTDQRDESGRAGIRRAVIAVMQPGECAEYLNQRLARYPDAVQRHLTKRPTLGQRKQILDGALRLRGAAQLIFAHPYAGPERWQVVEALVVKLALSPLLALWRHGRVAPFTTLALDYRDESPLVVLPEERAQQLTRVQTISLA
jgi:hypothetical protein